MGTTMISLKWLDGLRAQAQTEDGIKVDVSAGRDYGEGSAVSPMELLLISLAACSALATISILTRMTQGLRGVAVEVEGTTVDGYPKVFTDIELRYTFSGVGLKAQSIERALELMEEKYCPVSTMLGRAATLRYTWQIKSREAADVGTGGN